MRYVHQTQNIRGKYQKFSNQDEECFNEIIFKIKIKGEKNNNEQIIKISNKDKNLSAYFLQTFVTDTDWAEVIIE